MSATLSPGVKPIRSGVNGAVTPSGTESGLLVSALGQPQHELVLLVRKASGSGSQTATALELWGRIGTDWYQVEVIGDTAVDDDRGVAVRVQGAQVFEEVDVYLTGITGSGTIDFLVSAILDQVA